LRAGAGAVIACGLAAGSYGIASAASGASAAKPASQALATSSSPSKPAKPSTTSPKPRLARPGGFGRFGPGFGRWGAGPAAFGRGGTITGLSATTITVDTPFGGSLTVTTNASTTYSESGKKIARSALASGEQVMFLRAPAVGSNSSSTGPSSPVETVVIVLPHVSGKVMSVNGSVVVVAQQDGLNVTVKTSSSTTYQQGGQSAPASDLQAGTEVFVTGTLSSDHDQIDATTIEIVLPSVAGRVTGVSGTTITITTFGGTTETVTTGSSTAFTDSSGKTTIASVARGDFLLASGRPGSNNSFAAVSVRVGQGPSAVPVLPVPGGPGGFGPGPFRDGANAAGPGPFGGFGGVARWGARDGAVPGTASDGTSPAASTPL
jgi:hypothetical protein